MSSPDAPDAAIDAHSRTALASTKTNLRYLYDPKTARGVDSRRTRVLLRILRSSFLFVFWRLVRYAKYVAIGSLVATLGAGALGTFVSGAGFVLAPTGILGTVVAGTVWGVGRVAVGRVRGRWERGSGYGVGEEREEREERERVHVHRGRMRFLGDVGVGVVLMMKVWRRIFGRREK